MPPCMMEAPKPGWHGQLVARGSQVCSTIIGLRLDLGLGPIRCQPSLRCAELEAKGLLPRSGGRWHATTVRDLLAAEVA
jgi:hypothetical protein